MNITEEAMQLTFTSRNLQKVKNQVVIKYKYAPPTFRIIAYIIYEVLLSHQLYTIQDLENTTGK